MQPGARVVDQGVEAIAPEGFAQGGLYGFGKRAEAAAISDIEGQRGGVAAPGSNTRDDVIGCAGAGEVSDDHIYAALGELQRHALAEPAAAAGDECDAS